MSTDPSVDTSRKQLRDITFSVLDLAPILVGGTAAESFRNSLSLAQHAEQLGYHRYWLAEHHNMPGIASSATSVVIGYIAGGTSTIRVGSGGIMLPNHAPLVIAEQFGTLEAMYPGRIDLGLGRAPGSDQATARALRRGLNSHGEDFPEQLEQLRAYLQPLRENPPVRAVPGEGMDIPIWLLGSSDFSASLAGQLGLPFAFASHFAADYTLPALAVYRSHFRPGVIDEPYAMVGVNVVAADTDEEAHYLSTSMQLQYLNIVRGRPGQLHPPVDDIDNYCADYEKQYLVKRVNSSMIGGPEAVKRQLQRFLDQTQADEMIINSAIYDHKARLHSYEIVSQIVKE